MNTPNLSLSFTFRDLVTGEVEHIEIDWNEMWSLTLPFQPAILNIGNTGKIRAYHWRHAETGWYNEEHEFLNRLLANRPDLTKLVAESRLLLYAVFAKTADSLGGQALSSKSCKHFIRNYQKFCYRWQCCPSLPPALCSGKQPESPEDYLNVVHPGSYADLRGILQMLADAD